MKFLKIYLIIFFSFMLVVMYRSSQVDNPIQTTATLFNYTYLENYNEYDEDCGSWHGIYKYTVDEKDYTFTGCTGYRPKSIVPKTIKINYNEQDHSDFRECMPFGFSFAMFFIVIANLILLLKPLIKNALGYDINKKRTL